jgi:hypothetical protein
LESGDPIGQGDGLVARKNRKLKVLNKEQLKKWDDGGSKQRMFEISLEKYKACDKALEILKQTKDAQLWHYIGRGGGKVRFTHLEDIRDHNL